MPMMLGIGNHKIAVERADAPKITVDALIDTKITSFCLCQSQRFSVVAELEGADTIVALASVREMTGEF